MWTRLFDVARGSGERARMGDEVSIFFDDAVWNDLLRTQALPGGSMVPPAVWEQLAKAPLIRNERPVPRVMRVATLTSETARELERWLEDIARRIEAPRNIDAARRATRDGLRLAE